MGDIDVEAVESLADEEIPAGVDAPEYVLYGGKGGVGKTTMAAATALSSARGGTPTLAVSTDPAHSLSDTLDTDVPSEPARVREDVPLYAVEIDPEAMAGGPFGAGGVDLGGLEGLLGGVGGPDPAGGPDDPYGGSGEAPGETSDASGGTAGGTMPIPGADEAAAVQLLLEYLDDPRFERVVVDTAPTGHTLRLLELPEVMDTMLGRLVTLRERLKGALGDLAGLFGGDEAEGAADLRAVRERIERLRSALRDPDRTDFRVVMVPEEMSVRETERLLARLEAFGVPVGTVVVNRVMQDLADVADVEADWFVAPSLETCEFCRRRWEVQRGALARAQEVFRGHDVRRVPLFADEVRGETMLQVVAACLE